jgi:hypothetical protein
MFLYYATTIKQLDSYHFQKLISSIAKEKGSRQWGGVQNSPLKCDISLPKQ